MKKTMTNSEMFDCIVVMSRLEEEGALGLAIATNLHRLKDAAKDYLEARDKLLDTYGEIQPNGRATIPPKNQAALDKEMKAIGKLTTEVELCTVDREMFMGGTLKSNQMEAILWMMEDTKNEQEKRE